MRYKLSFLAALFVAGTFLTGCAKTEAKLGRGMANTMEIVRLGEWRRTMEQTALFRGPDKGYSTGFVSGLTRSVARTGVGVYEIVTAPFPPYDPVFTDYLSPAPAYPDNYKPNLLEDSLFATDANLGFSGGDINPLIPGSRFRIFDTH
jgi:putative exosortase-associated protein (TIGR04073 family)